MLAVKSCLGCSGRSQAATLSKPNVFEIFPRGVPFAVEVAVDPRAGQPLVPGPWAGLFSDNNRTRGPRAGFFSDHDRIEVVRADDCRAVRGSTWSGPTIAGH